MYGGKKSGLNVSIPYGKWSPKTEPEFAKMLKRFNTLWEMEPAANLTNSENKRFQYPMGNGAQKYQSLGKEKCMVSIPYGKWSQSFWMILCGESCFNTLWEMEPKKNPVIRKK